MTLDIIISSFTQIVFLGIGSQQLAEAPFAPSSTTTDRPNEWWTQQTTTRPPNWWTPHPPTQSTSEATTPGPGVSISWKKVIFSLFFKCFIITKYCVLLTVI